LGGIGQGEGTRWLRPMLAVVLVTMAGGSVAAGAQAAPSTSGGKVSNPDQTSRAEQKSSADAAAKAEESQEAVPAPTNAGVLLDRVVAVVNGDVVLESDVDEERRMAVFQPISSPEGNTTREKAIERLVNRRLLLQQAKLQPQHAITEADIDAQLEQVRKEVPACEQAHCETDAGWAKFLAARGVTSNEVRSHWRERMEALQFVEVRFRSGIRISHTEIQDYYEKTMLPEYAKQKVKAPPLEKISDRIHEVLLQQQVSGLLSDWLKSLRAQGTVQIVQDGADPV
jgi:peptidyl-prolyl cis-trans isomerase SurA